MTNLTSAQPRQFRAMQAVVYGTYPASAALFQGSAVEEDGSGNMQNATGAGTTFQGFLTQSAAAVNDRVEVALKGSVRLSVAKATNWAATDLGSAVQATDGNTFTLVVAGGQQIGKVEEIESGIGTTTAICWVYFEGQTIRSI
jgi:hypothetical protein